MCLSSSIQEEVFLFCWGGMTKAFVEIKNIYTVQDTYLLLNEEAGMLLQVVVS